MFFEMHLNMAAVFLTWGLYQGAKDNYYVCYRLRDITVRPGPKFQVWLQKPDFGLMKGVGLGPDEIEASFGLCVAWKHFFLNNYRKLQQAVTITSNQERKNEPWEQTGRGGDQVFNRVKVWWHQKNRMDKTRTHGDTFWIFLERISKHGGGRPSEKPQQRWRIRMHPISKTIDLGNSQPCLYGHLSILLKLVV